MKWTVGFSARVRKQRDKLPPAIFDAFAALVREIQEGGPVRSGWPHYGKLKGRSQCHHCHLNKGKPRYVAVWQVVDGKICFVEVRYVGTHEGADYGRVC